MIKQRLEQLRKSMKKAEIDIYVIPTSDYHDSEYVSNHFCAREYFSGFTGSAGTLVVGANEAALFTDGRYFLQAEAQLAGTGITLMKIGEKDVPTVSEYIEKTLPEKGTLGFDGRVINTQNGRMLSATAEKKNGKTVFDVYLVDEVWKDRPAIVHTEVFLLEEKYSGENTSSKLERLREKMSEIGASLHIIASLDDIAWLFNIRANDIHCCPLVLSYAVITRRQALLFAEKTAFPQNVQDYLADSNVQIMPYNDIYDFVRVIGEEETVLLSSERTNYCISQSIGDNVKVIEKENPTTHMKAIKNQTEIENLRRCHVKDGVAATKFMFWLKNNIGKIGITEISASDYIEQKRREQDGFIELSFDTISAYNENAAMIHYSATEDSNAALSPKGMLLVDSGGHYYEGTTDLTRTFILGKITNQMKLHYTATVKSLLNLRAAKFPYGVRGVNLDILARGPMWDMGLDYRCGTGHGVGYLMNVHEAPNGFRWRIVPERNDSAVLEEGMVTTDEPGLYIEGSHGIRIENELLCRKGEQTEYGQFMYFEDLTVVPIDLDGLDTEYLNETDIERLNDYHADVYEKLSPYFFGEKLDWLKNVTRKITKNLDK